MVIQLDDLDHFDNTNKIISNKIPLESNKTLVMQIIFFNIKIEYKKDMSPHIEVCGHKGNFRININTMKIFEKDKAHINSL